MILCHLALRSQTPTRACLAKERKIEFLSAHSRKNWRAQGIQRILLIEESEGMTIVTLIPLDCSKTESQPKSAV